MTHRKIGFSLLTSIFLLFPAAAAYPQPDAKPKTPSWLQFSFEQRTRYERMTNPFRLAEFGAKELLPLRTRLKLEIGENDRPVRFLLEFQDSRALHDEQAVFFSPVQVNKHDLLQLQFQFHSNDFFGKGLESRFTIGRFTMDLGKRRLVARNNMRNTTNSFDGVMWALAGDTRWKLRTFFTSFVIIDSEKMDSSNPNRFFWGAYYESMRWKRLRTEIYYLGLHESDRTLTRRRHSTVGLRLFEEPSPGRFDFEVESAWQFGKTGVQDHFSLLQHGELGFSFDAPWTPRLSFQYDYAGGDGNPGDDQSGRFNTLFGARSFEYTPTGIFGPFYRSNLNTPGARFVFSPLRRLEVTASYRAFWLARARDAWVGSGLLDPTGRSGKTLGQNLETDFKWRAKEFFLLQFGYSHFFKGSYLDRVPGSPRTADSNYFFIAAEVDAQVLPYGSP